MFGVLDRDWLAIPMIEPLAEELPECADRLQNGCLAAAIATLQQQSALRDFWKDLAINGNVGS